MVHAIHVFLSETLAWPQGILVGNLLASVIWSSIFEWRLRVHHKKTRKMQEHHEHLMKRILAKLDEDRSSNASSDL